MKTKEIHISDYSYDLPEERIAKYPKAQRDQSKLLVYNNGEVEEDIFCNLPQHLPSGALMVFNNTKVIQARLHFRKTPTVTRGQSATEGALIEIFLLEPALPADYEQMFQQTHRCQWLCLIGNQKKWKEGALVRRFEIGDGQLEIKATRLGERGTSQLVEFEWAVSGAAPDMETVGNRTDGENVGHCGQCSFAEVLDALGELPIPPYLNRRTEESDKTTYQTVYSKIKGSVAAPTAGLHFTERVLADVDARGIEREELTLHVGAGTFRPVKSETIGEHPMHTEYIAVRRHTIERLLAHGCEAIAVGTTSVRTLESLYYMGLKVLANPDIDEEGLHVNQWEPYDGTLNEKWEMGNEKWEMGNEKCVPGEEPSPSDAHHAQEPSPSVALQALLGWMERRGLTVLHSSTQIIIAPGYDYKIVKMLVTNFHQPQSTLLLLVSAFVKGDWRKIYDYALTHEFRFLSYGDSSLLIP